MSFVDTLEAEIQSATTGMQQVMENQSVWGVADDTGFTGDAYQYSGIFPWIINDNPTNGIFDVGGTITLSVLDNMLDATVHKFQMLSGGKWAFIASPAMISKIGSLQTLIRRQVQQVDFEGGFTMDSYRSIPIISSGYVGPSPTSASVTGLSASAGGTGSVTGTYRYKVAAINLYGEQVASATAAGVLSSNTTATLTWTATTGAKSYAIYRTALNDADTASLYKLLDIVPALTYTNGAGVLTASPSYADTFVKTTVTNVVPLATGQETIFLVYLDKPYGVSLAILPPTLGDPLGGDPVANLVRYVTLNETTDTYQFRLKSYQVLQVPDASTMCFAHRVAYA